MKLLNRIACLIGLCLLPLLVEAARMEGLFQAEVEVAGRESAARDAGLQEALREVLVRVSGSSNSLSEPAVRSLLKQPGRFVQQFRYRKEAGESPDASDRLLLWVQFDGVALEKEIRRSGLPFWGRERPDILVWLAIDDQGRRFLVSEHTEHAAAGFVRRAAVRRGLPMTLPLLDLEDQRAVQFTEVWGGFTGALEEASERYRPRVILVGTLGRSRMDAEWRTRWTLLADGGSQNWTAHAQNLDLAVSRGVHEAAEWLSLQYAVVTSDVRTRPLVVEGIQGLQDYARVHDYLAGLTSVDRVQVVRVSDQEVEFHLQLSAEERNLLQIITLGKVLESVQDPSFWRFRIRP